MPRQKQQMSRLQGPKTVSHDVLVRDGSSSVVGRATVTADASGKAWVSLQQTYGGSADGTLKEPVKCDLDVLLAICTEAEAIADSLG